MQVTGTSATAYRTFSSLSGRKNPSVQDPKAKTALTQDPRSNKRDILYDSVTSSRKNVPALKASGPLALFRAADAVKFLSAQVDSQKVPIADGLENTARFRDLKISQINELRTAFQNLQARVDDLRQTDALNTLSSKSTHPGVIQAQAGKNSPRGAYSVEAGQRADVNVLVSDVQTESSNGLGLAGNFSVNGFRVAVVSADTLFTIRNKINFGEDGNQNGALDGPEDLNGNGILETHSVAATEFGPGVFIAEDGNGNGSLDVSEDLNGNGRLDGGTGDTKVIASVAGNRLVLTSLSGASGRIDLGDEDDVLLSLGVFEQDGKGNSVLKERQLDPDHPAVNLNKNPQPAKIKVDGTTFTSNSNTFQNAIEDATLTLKQVSDRKVEVSIVFDAADAVSRIQSLFTQFNESVGALNDILAQSGAFQGDADIQGIRNHLTRTPQEKTRELAERNRNIDAVNGHTENQRLVGIEIKNTQKNGVEEAAVTSAVQTLKSGMTLPFKNADRNLLTRLTSIGIRTREDDTFAVDGEKLERALKINPEEVLDLFNDAEKGILPALDKQLTRILDSGLGDLDLKRQDISLRAKVPDRVAEKLRQFSENSNLTEKVQTLIAVA